MSWVRQPRVYRIVHWRFTHDFSRFRNTSPMALAFGWFMLIYSYVHLLVITGSCYGITHCLNGVIITYNW